LSSLFAVQHGARKFGAAQLVEQPVKNLAQEFHGFFLASASPVTDEERECAVDNVAQSSRARHRSAHRAGDMGERLREGPVLLKMLLLDSKFPLFSRHRWARAFQGSSAYAITRGVLWSGEICPNVRYR
jgi:hypothetical protein